MKLPAKKKGKRGGARSGSGNPPFVPTDSQRSLVSILAGIFKHEDIASQIGPRGIDPKTLRQHFPHELEAGKSRVDALCAQGIVKAMQAGEAWALCFYAKTRMGWRERSALDEVSEITVKRLVGVAIEDV